MDRQTKLLSIGLDGATFDVLNPLLRAGMMPRLAQLMDQGVYGPLESVFPPLTPTAWVSWMTGKNPGRHGVFEFLMRQPGGGPLPNVPVSSASRDGHPVWDLLAQVGRRSIVTNIPCTYPPSMVNGLMVSDFLTPPGRPDFTHPASLRRELESRFGPYRLYLTAAYRRGGIDRMLDQLFDELDYKTRVNRYLMAEHPWDLFATHYLGPDRLQHELWHVIDPGHPLFDAREHAAHTGRIHAYWRAVDGAMGSLVDAAGADTTVHVMSDHGFGPATHFLCVNLWLMEEGLLVVKRGALARMKHALFRLGLTQGRVFRPAIALGVAGWRYVVGLPLLIKLRNAANIVLLSLADVDWSKTSAFSYGNYGQIFLNLRGREPEGIVQPGEESDRLLRRITERLHLLRHPVTREPLIGAVWRREDLYAGPHAWESPDLQFLPRDMAIKPFGPFDFPSNQVFTPSYGKSGNHRMHGIFIGRGPALRRGGTLSGARIIDVAPTILRLFGVRPPATMDGRVLDELFADAPPIEADAVSVSGGERARPEARMSPEEVRAVQDRLRALGYLG